MERYYQTVALLGLNDGNLPVHRGMRQKRYESVEKMLDLLDVVKRIGPKFPLQVAALDRTDPEWDDDMTFLNVDYTIYKHYAILGGFWATFMLYNYNAFFHNKNLAFATKAYVGIFWAAYNFLYIRYRKQVLRCNLFDEYC